MAGRAALIALLGGLYSSRDNAAGRLLYFSRLILADHLFDLFAFFCGNLAERAIFFTCCLALRRRELRPGHQAILEAPFFIHIEFGIMLRQGTQTLLLFFRQTHPLRMQRCQRFAFCGRQG